MIKLINVILILLIVFSHLTSGKLFSKQSGNSITDDSKQGKSNLFPIVLVPGDGGSQIEAKLNKKRVVHRFCNSHTDYYFTMWISLSEVLPYAIDCFTDNMKLVYDNVTRTTSNSPGVDTRIPGFGETQTIEYLDPNQIPVTGYFNIMVDYFINLGYQRGKNIRGAPYDFRKSPSELTDYLDQFKIMIEGTSESNFGLPCVIICHSMGCPLMLYFLIRQSDEWKSNYVRNLVTLASPWGGAVKAMKAFATGENLGVLVVPNLTVRRDERTFPSMAFLLPSQSFWPTTETIIKVGATNYSTANYDQFFDNINYPVGYQMWLDLNNTLPNLPPPGVPVNCVYGIGTKTMEYLEYDPPEHFPDHRPKIIYGDGDGTVNLRSLEGCLRWEDQQPQIVQHFNVSGVDHLSILADPSVLNYIKSIVMAQN